MRRDLITTCSISNIVILKGSRAENRADEIPGVSTPESRINPV
jgi:hypothetical protein